MITVKQPPLGDIHEESEWRIEDTMEWLAGCGRTIPWQCRVTWPFEYIRAAYDEDDRLLCMWGVEASNVHGVGNVWLAATNKAVPRAKAIHRHLKAELGAILELYPELQCWADARNTTHHTWLRWLGFKEYGEKPYGYLGLPFKYFHYGDDPCASQQ